MAAPTNFVTLPFALVDQGDVIAAGVVFPVVGLAAVTLRYYVRKVQKVSWGPDDWLMLPAVVLLCGMGACFITGAALKVMGYPTPLPQADEPLQVAVQTALNSTVILGKIEFAFQLLSLFQLGLTKLSIVLFCRRVFLASKATVFSTISMALVVTITCWILGLFLTVMLFCRGDLNYTWEPLQEVQAKCGNPLVPELVFVISDLITDFLILLLPLPVIWGLNMPRSRRLVVSGIFMVGLMAIAASIARMVIYRIVFLSSIDGGYDLNRVITTMLYWTMIESGMLLVTACLPTLRFLVRDVSLTRLTETLRRGVSSSQRSFFRSQRRMESGAEVGRLDDSSFDGTATLQDSNSVQDSPSHPSQQSAGSSEKKGHTKCGRRER